MTLDETLAGSMIQPAHPDFERVVRASFARQGLMTSIGARLVDVAPGRVRIELPYAASISQQNGLFHGGIVGAIADNAGGYAALSLMPAGSEVLTVEYKINFMRPASGNLLRATGHVMRAGKTMTVVRAEVECVSPAATFACALLQATMMRLSENGGSAPG